MPIFELETIIAAPPERVFDLSRDVDAHLASTARTGEELVAGPRGLLSLGDEVTWRARHLGVRQTLSSKITGFDRPRWFRDEMTRGAFARFAHDHFFEPDAGDFARTRMRDRIDFASPLGSLGRLVDAVFLEGYLRRFIAVRNAWLKAEAERR